MGLRREISVAATFAAPTGQRHIGCWVAGTILQPEISFKRTSHKITLLKLRCLSGRGGILSTIEFIFSNGLGVQAGLTLCIHWPMNSALAQELMSRKGRLGLEFGGSPELRGGLVPLTHNNNRIDRGPFSAQLGSCLPSRVRSSRRGRGRTRSLRYWILGSVGRSLCRARGHAGRFRHFRLASRDISPKSLSCP